MMVRSAAPADARAIATIEVCTWQVAYRALLPESYLQALSINEKTEEWQANLRKHGVNGQKRVCVALDHHDVIGFVRVGTLQEQAPIGLLYLLYVLPTYWNQGIGTTLMRAGMHELKDLGHTTAVLWVLRDNVRARQFYERGGWQPDGQITSMVYGGASVQALCYQRSVEEHR